MTQEHRGRGVDDRWLAVVLWIVFLGCYALSVTRCRKLHLSLSGCTQEYCLLPSGNTSTPKLSVASNQRC